MSSLFLLAQSNGAGFAGLGIGLVCVFALVGLALTAFHIWMIIDCAVGPLEPVMKIVWIIIMLVFPLVGPLAFFFIARGKR